VGVLAYLIPISIVLGAAGLGAFFWALRNGQFDDPDGAAQRILFDDDEEQVERRHGDPPRRSH
jgi:cbb3-type cytochrome oxidase maturation protein